MNVHRCRLCQLAERPTIERWRTHEGLTLRQIQRRMADEYGISVSLGLLGKHFKFVDTQIAAAVESFAQDDATAAMQIFPDGRAVLDKVVKQLMPDGERVARPQWIPYLVAVVKEMRESAQAELRYTPADPDNKAAAALESFAELVGRAVEPSAEEEREEGDNE